MVMVFEGSGLRLVGNRALGQRPLHLWGQTISRMLLIVSRKIAQNLCRFNINYYINYTFY